MLPDLTILNAIGILATFLGVWLVSWSVRTGSWIDILHGSFWILVAWVMFNL